MVRRWANFGVPPGPVAEYTADPPVVHVSGQVTFTAHDSQHTKFTWSFGDGTTSQGRKVKHRFGDANGTQLGPHTCANGGPVRATSMPSINRFPGLKIETWAPAEVSGLPL